MDTQLTGNLNKTSTRIGTFPGTLLRLEGAAVFAGAIALYASQGASWLLFAVLFFVPDLSMVGYLINPRIGSLTYNAIHTYALPAILVVLAFAFQWTTGIHIALIWFAHVGMDRTLGYGLKYPSAFKDTHLQQV